MEYVIDNRFNLGVNEGSSDLAQNYFIIVHETDNPRATGENEATFMKRNWRNAYTTHIVGDGKVYVIGEVGYISYGAGYINPYAPVQIELQHTLDKELFKKNYAIYVTLIRDMCDRFKIPKTLDSKGEWTKGVKSHDWVSKNWSGNHTDPYGYLTKMGVSKEQFARDIANGVGGTVKVEEPKFKHWVYTGTYSENGGGDKALVNFLKENGMGYTRTVKDKKVSFDVGWFGMGSSWKYKLEKYLSDRELWFEVRTKATLK